MNDENSKDVTDINVYIESLETENRYLKSLLDKAGIAYDVSVQKTQHNVESCLQDQCSRIKPHDITAADANRFYDRFWGRMDVYSRRSVNKTTGRASYYPQCANFWKNGCHRKNKDNIKCQDCDLRSYKRLELRDVMAHLRGDSAEATDVIGIYPLFPDGSCRFLVFDFDNHEKGAEDDDFANVDDTWKEEVDALRTICELNGIDPLVERSRSGRGAHVWIFFDKPVDAALARRFGDNLLKRGSESVNLKSFDFYDRMLPMQDQLPPGGLGNLIALPLQGLALKSGNSAFIDENWNAYADQWEVLLSKPKYSQEFIESKIKEWDSDKPIIEGIATDEFLAEDDEKPWERTDSFSDTDVDGMMQIVLSDGIYIDTSNLRPRIQNRIRELAAFKNPVYYKNQAMGLSNFSNSRFIYLGSDEGGYIKIPRGLKDSVVSACKGAGIKYHIEDRRNYGNPINVTFCGELKEIQATAVRKILRYDDGILCCATGFGKTVAACFIIAQRMTSTLILLESTTLIDQWKKAIDDFLIINEELPEYRTPSGKIRRRKNLTGVLQSGRDTTTGIIDIAMVGSVCKNGEFHQRLKEYGLIILDESHHAAAETILDILQNVNAKYVYGLTATPKREDGLEKINYMLLGPVRYNYTAKDRAKDLGIEHYVYPRFTHSVAPEFFTDYKNSNKNYEILRKDLNRDDMIINDVIGCVTAGRTPLVLSRYIDHTKRLYERLKEAADHVFILLGENSGKEHRRIMEEMKKVPVDESMILLATGSLVGEGFDYPRLDTLVMAMPAAGRTVVEQYAGWLDREYPGKKNVFILDYVDSHIRMFDNMYHKRLRAYRHISYSIYSEDTADKTEEVNSIFDIDNYRAVFDKDLLEARDEIIISSPALAAKKVDEMISLLKCKIESGVKVIIITWQPDRYGYGDSSNWLLLQSRLRNAGFDLNLVEDYCERYCITDREIVWYGSVNFLGKEDADDNLMRICSRRTAAELLELTFGNEKTVPFRADEIS